MKRSLKVTAICCLLPILILLLPSIQIGPIYSYTIAKTTIICLISYFLFIRRIQIPKPRIELIILACFYSIRILLLVPQFDIAVFQQTSQTILFFIVLIVYFHILEEILGKKYKHNLTSLFIIISLFDLVNNLLLFIFKNDYLRMWQPFLYPGDYAITLMNVERGRVYFGNYPELIIPFAVFMGGIWQIGLIGLTFFSVLVAGFRTNLVMAGFALISSLLVFKRHLFNHLMGILVLICVGGTLILLFVTFVPQAQTVDRIFYDQTEGYATIESRLNYIRLGLDLFQSSPFIGIGTNSFKEYLPVRKDKYSYSKSQLAVSDNARDPHNFIVTILSEGGILSLGVFLMMLYVSLKKDVRKITPAVIAFWSLFLYSMANPVAESLKFNLLFILLRFMI